MNSLLTGIKNISQGNLTTEIPVYRTDEFGRLAQSINSMVKTAVEAMKLSAVDFIPKPFTRDEIYNTVENTVARLKD